LKNYNVSYIIKIEYNWIPHILNSLKDLEEKISNFKAKHMHPHKSEKALKSSGVYVITELIASIGLGALIGYQLDQYFSTHALFLFIFIILGLISSLYNIYIKLK